MISTIPLKNIFKNKNIKNIQSFSRLNIFKYIKYLLKIK